MTTAMTPASIELKDLSLHDQNVRAKSPETYTAENIAHLMASIAAVGLIGVCSGRVQNDTLRSDVMRQKLW